MTHRSPYLLIIDLYVPHSLFSEQSDSVSALLDGWRHTETCRFFLLYLYKILLSYRFDTYRSKDESRRLAKYVDGVEAGLILAMVVNDEGSNNLEDSAKKSLSRLGSLHISTLGFR